MKRPIRLLELRSAWGPGGGPEKTILLSAARHDRSRVRPRVVYLRSPGDATFASGVRERARAVGTRILEVPDRGRFDPVCIARLRKLARRADVIHAHDYKTDVYALLLGRGGGRARLLSTAHGWTGESLKVRVYQSLDTLSLRFFDKVLAVSQATRDVLLSARVEPDRIEVVPNAIDEREWSPRNDRGDLRRELGLVPGELVVGTVARLSREKGIDQLVEIAARADAALAARRAPRAVFLVAGEGPERADLEARIARAGLGRRFRLLGHRSDPIRVANTFDLAVIPSRVENSPNALLEAMALGKPCVAFSVGGVAELAGEAVRLVPAGDTDAFAAEVCVLLGNAPARRRLGAEARGRVEALFSFSRRLARMEDIYEELVAGERAGTEASPSGYAEAA